LPPLKGSHLSPDENNCATCHTEPDIWQGDQRKFYVDKQKLATDVHFTHGVNCHDCHGGNFHAGDIKEAPHAKEDFFRAKPEEMRKICAYCHKDQAIDLFKGMHARAGEKNELGQATTLACEKCHGPVAHVLWPVRDERSPVFSQNQVKTCGGCHKHQKELISYMASVHGQGLFRAGLVSAAVCADCHGAHGVYLPADKRSTLHTANVAQTCGKCHRFLEERLMKSVHGGGNGPGGLALRSAPGGKTWQHPSCTSCHQGHNFADPDSARFRLQLPNVCGNCHSDLSNRYAMSVHGQLTELGYLPAAKCSDCHGSHDILRVKDARSTLSPAHRLQTCRKCHPSATVNFAAFNPHADYRDPKYSQVVHAVYVSLMTLLVTTFSVFGIHTLLWLVRSLIEVLRHGRPKGLAPGQPAFVRFNHFHRSAHTVLLISFLGLALTGLPLKYSHYDWAKGLAAALGGFDSTRIWHRLCAVLMMACLVAYLVRLPRLYWAGRRRGASVSGLLFGPNSVLPNWRDLRDLFGMLRWFAGLGPKPTFERWTYWEKFDFWGACADVVIIGSTGLVLWFPYLFCRFLPATALNIAQVIHSTQALLATGFVFAIHFFNTHLRPEKFPADMSILTGLVSEEEMLHERPDLLARWQKEGAHDREHVTVPSRGTLWLIRLAGLTALAVGLALLAAILITAATG
jgi:cytochrome b subunit of formate dehydrogenase